jgi:hypothetical protein
LSGKRHSEKKIEKNGTGERQIGETEQGDKWERLKEMTKRE